MADPRDWGLPHRLSFHPIQDPRLKASGRITFLSHGGCRLHYGASGFEGEFFGRSLAVLASGGEHPMSLGVVIDGSPEIIVDLVGTERKVYQVAVGLEKGRHRVSIHRRSDCWRGSVGLEGILLDQGAELGERLPESSLKIAFFGDSILAGGLSDAAGFEGQEDSLVATHNPEDRLTSGYWGFGAMAARELRAEAQVNGIGGLALLDGTGWYFMPEAIGWETTWNKLNPVKGQLTPWDFSRFSPQVIVCSLGQNCAKDGDIHDPQHRERWVNTYCSILSGLKEVQPEAQFLLTTTIMFHDPSFDAAIEEVQERATRAGLPSSVYHFKREGKGTPGHLRWEEEHEMALELAEAIRGLI